QDASPEVRRVEEGRIEAFQHRPDGRVEQHEPIGNLHQRQEVVMVCARVRRVLLDALAPLFVAAPCFSQALTGTITGRALDTGGGVLPGVEIAVSSPAMIGGPRTVFSDTQGVYRATQ